jgi:formylglycine-generating enzyme required for sulfatase activity
MMWCGDGNNNEKPVHEVCVDGFWMGQTEVTQGQWQRVMWSNPSHFKKGDNYPVEEKLLLRRALKNQDNYTAIGIRAI